MNFLVNKIFWQLNLPQRILLLVQMSKDAALG